MPRGGWAQPGCDCSAPKSNGFAALVAGLGIAAGIGVAIAANTKTAPMTTQANTGGTAKPTTPDNSTATGASTSGSAAGAQSGTTQANFTGQLNSAGSYRGVQALQTQVEAKIQELNGFVPDTTALAVTIEGIDGLNNIEAPALAPIDINNIEGAISTTEANLGKITGFAQTLQSALNTCGEQISAADSSINTINNGLTGARQALEAAQRSGDNTQIQAKQEQVHQFEQQLQEATDKKAALLEAQGRMQTAQGNCEAVKTILTTKQTELEDIKSFTEGLNAKGDEFKAKDEELGGLITQYNSAMEANSGDVTQIQRQIQQIVSDLNGIPTTIPTTNGEYPITNLAAASGLGFANTIGSEVEGATKGAGTRNEALTAALDRVDQHNVMNTIAQYGEGNTGVDSRGLNIMQAITGDKSGLRTGGTTQADEVEKLLSAMEAKTGTTRPQNIDLNNDTQVNNYFIQLMMNANQATNTQQALDGSNRTCEKYENMLGKTYYAVDGTVVSKSEYDRAMTAPPPPSEPAT